MLRVAISVWSFLYVHVWFVTALSAAEATTAPRPLPTEGEAKILAAFGQTTTVDFAEKPLSGVVDALKQKHKIEIQFDETALADAGAGSDTPITVRLGDITLRSLLRLMLGQLDLTYVVRDGYLLITSKTEAENMLRIRVYPVRDLVTLDGEFRPPQPPDQHGHEDYAGLIELITSTVAPHTWDEVGGPGSIKEYRNSHSITIAQTEEVNEEIVELLSALRRVRDLQLAAAKAAPRVVQPQPPANDEGLRIEVYRLLPWPAHLPWPNFGGFGMGAMGDGMGGGMGGGMFRLADEDASRDAAKNPDPSPAPSTPATTSPKPEPKSASQPSSPATATAWDQRLADEWAKELARTLPELVEPGSWGPDGNGSVRVVAGAIVVRQKREVQQKVAAFLAELLPGRVVTWAPMSRPAVRLPAPGPQLDWPQEVDAGAAANHVRIEEALAKKCDVEFREEQLAKAIDTLAVLGPIQVWRDEKALADAGVAYDTPITRSIHGVSLRTAFKLLLGQLDLTYVIRNEVFTITSKTEAENMLVTKVYPVFDLIASVPGDARHETRRGFHLVGMQSGMQSNSWQSADMDF
ncbi:MAG: hypothetical protein B7Z73_14665, partial [Planctomycetia bacterium 21-64-5]